MRNPAPYLVTRDAAPSGTLRHTHGTAVSRGPRDLECPVADRRGNSHSTDRLDGPIEGAPAAIVAAAEAAVAEVAAASAASLAGTGPASASDAAADGPDLADQADGLRGHTPEPAARALAGVILALTFGTLAFT